MRERWLILVTLVASLAIGLAAAGAARADSLAVTCTGGNSSSSSCDESGDWQGSAVSVTWNASPVPTKTEGCASTTYGDISTIASCEVWWGAGGTPPDQSIGFPLNVEASNPTANAIPARPPDSNGWYNKPVAITFAGVSSFSGFSSCQTTTFHGPDGANQTVSGNCIDNAGKTAPASYTLNYDATPPTMTGAVPSRPPDHNGWYNHPVSFAFSGTDSISGIASCSRPTYSGPDTASAVVTGTCTDRAGNVATLPVSLNYDSTPPTLDASASPGDGIVNLNWNATESVAPVTSVQIARSPGFNGATTSALHRGHSGSFRDTSVRNWVTYKYTIKAWDQAGNEKIRTITVTPGPRVLGPANGARLTTPPTLRWTPIHSATYYNVQLFRRDGKVLSTWPARAKLQLKHTWHFGGHVYRLKPGKYRWYVWPGYGRRSVARYGSMVGKGTFVVTSPKSTAAANLVYPAIRMLAPDASR